MTETTQDPIREEGKPLSVRRRLFFVFVTMIALLVIAELALHLFWTPPPIDGIGSLNGSGLYVRDDQVGWRMAPNKVVEQRLYANPDVTIRTNSRGFRDEERSIAEGDGRRSVVVMGDSFTFGWGVPYETTFTVRLRETFPEIDFVNLGISGYDLAQQRTILHSEGLRHQPGVVIVPVCLNDFETGDIFAANPIQGPPPARQSGWKATLRRHSRLYTLCTHAMDASPRITRALVWLGLRAPGGGIESVDSALQTSLREYSPEIQAKVDRVRTTLDAIVRDCHEIGARVLIAPIPSPESVRPAVLSAKLHYTTLTAEDFDLDKPYRLIAEWAAERGARFVDARASFRQGSGLFLRYDAHFSPDGHAVFANELAPTLRDLLQTPLPAPK